MSLNEEAIPGPAGAPGQQHLSAEDRRLYFESDSSGESEPDRTEENPRTMPMPIPKQRKIKELPWTELEYIGGYDEQLECAICRNPFVDPITIACGHTFCGGCLARHQSYDNTTCPIDRKPISRLYTSDRRPITSASLVVINQLNNLTVECPNLRCTHICPRSGLEYHYEQQCELTMIHCPDIECKKLIARGQAKTDPPQCSHRVSICLSCSKTIDITEVADHNRVCDERNIKCSFCSEDMKSAELNAHLLVCPDRIRKCRFVKLGCRFQAKVGEFGDHDDHCPFKVGYFAELRCMEVEKKMLRNKEQLEEAMTRIRVLEHPHNALYTYSNPPGNGGIDPGQQSQDPSQPQNRAAVMAAGDFARVANLQREIDDMRMRHDAEYRTVGNEMGVARQQVTEVRNVTAQLSMQVRWLMDTMREAKRSTASMSTAGLADGTSTTAAGASRNESRGFATRRLSDESPRL